MEKIKVGIFGLNRGASHIQGFLANNAEIVAVCDKMPEQLEKAKAKLGNHVDYYTDFDEFIEHKMDAVLLANHFHEHVPYALRCLEKNIHVLSECTAASTIAECVALVRAAEKSKAKYMLCENYPFMKFNLEIKRVCDSGSLGKLLYAEGEYNHPSAPSDVNFVKKFRKFEKHWRHFLPATYYLTHSLAPLMYATGAEPIRVTALPVCFPAKDTYAISHCSDRAAVITTLNNDKSVFKFFGWSTFGGHGNSYRICGTDGQIENVRGTNGKIMLRYNAWSKPADLEEATQFYMPDWNDKDKNLIENSGHGGSDFIVVRNFLDCIRNDTQPCFDVYFATKMSAVAILGHRSLLELGNAYDVPDFRREEDRVKWENDTLSHFYYDDVREPTIPCGSDPNYLPSAEQLEAFRKDIAGTDTSDDLTNPMQG